MIEVRCVKCNRLLFKMDSMWGGIQIKCNKCGYMNDMRVDEDNGSLFIDGVKTLGYYEKVYHSDDPTRIIGKRFVLTV